MGYQFKTLPFGFLVDVVVDGPQVGAPPSHDRAVVGLVVVHEVGLLKCSPGAHLSLSRQRYQLIAIIHESGHADVSC